MFFPHFKASSSFGKMENKHLGERAQLFISVQSSVSFFAESVLVIWSYLKSLLANVMTKPITD